MQRRVELILASLCLLWAIGVDVVLVAGKFLPPPDQAAPPLVPLGLPVGLAALLVLSALWRARFAMIAVTALFAISCVLAMFSIGMWLLPSLGLAGYATLARLTAD